MFEPPPPPARTELVFELLEVAIHTILYARDVYPRALFEELMSAARETLPEVCENSWDCDYGLECCDLPFVETKICCGGGVRVAPPSLQPQALRVPTAERELAERERADRERGLLG